MDKATAVVHIAPAAGAQFTQYTAEFEALGSIQPSSMQRFVFVIEGEIETPGERLGPGGFAYFPAGQDQTLRAARPSRAVIIEKAYVPLTGWAAPKHFSGRDSQTDSQPLHGRRCRAGASASSR